MDTLLNRRDQHAAHLASTEALYAAIRRERRPLPSHELDGHNYRRWAAAVVEAESNHSDSDFWNAVHKHKAGLLFDRYQNDCPALYRFQHEVYARGAVNWLSHLQAHESLARKPYANGIGSMEASERKAWLARRRYLWAGFVTCVEKYRKARRELDALPPDARRAA